MHPEAKEELRRRLKLTVLEYAKHLGVTEACREFNVPHSTFYQWKEKYEQEGRAGLYQKKPIAYHHPRKTAPDVVEKNPRAADHLSNWCFADRVLPRSIPRDQDFRVDRD